MKTYIFTVSYNANFDRYIFRCEKLKYTFVFDRCDYELFDAMSETKKSFNEKLHLNILFEIEEA